MIFFAEVYAMNGNSLSDVIVGVINFSLKKLNHKYRRD